MVRMATLMTGSVAEAEELVMDAFARLAARSARLSDLDEPSAYLRTSVVNAVHSRHRHLRTLRALPPQRPEVGPDPIVDELWAQLERLSADQRRCVVLRYYEDLTVPQIAEVLSMPQGSVKSHLHRAIACLRDLVDGEER